MIRLTGQIFYKTVITDYGTGRNIAEKVIYHGYLNNKKITIKPDSLIIEDIQESPTTINFSESAEYEIISKEEFDNEFLNRINKIS